MHTPSLAALGNDSSYRRMNAPRARKMTVALALIVFYGDFRAPHRDHRRWQGAGPIKDDTSWLRGISSPHSNLRCSRDLGRSVGRVLSNHSPFSDKALHR
jgi:hypothetical protein